MLYNTSKWNKSLAAVQKSGEEMIDLYFEWLGRDMGLVSLEDIFHVADEGSFLKFKERLDQEIERAVAKAEEAGGDESDAALEEPVINFESVGNDPSCQLQLIGNALCASGDDMERYDVCLLCFFAIFEYELFEPAARCRMFFVCT